jgi:hypothetical protein
MTKGSPGIIFALSLSTVRMAAMIYVASQDDKTTANNFSVA